MKLSRQYAGAALVGLALAGAATVGVVAHAGSRTTTITVTEKEFRIHLSQARTKPGTVRLVVKDIGKYAHALAISGPGVKLKRTPLVHPGKSATLVVKLSAGTYAIWCPVPGHAAQGMKTSLKVAAAAATTTAPTTTSSGGGGAWG